jgi:preprotein translocase subunit SecG
MSSFSTLTQKKRFWMCEREKGGKQKTKQNNMRTLSFAIGIVWIICSIFMGLSTVNAFEKDCPSSNSENNEIFSNENLTIGTFNAMWLFDGIGDRLSPWKNASEAEVHAKLVAAQIYRLNLDVLNLVEVESCSILSTVVNEVDRIRKISKQIESTYNIYLKNGKDTATGQNVALLSKFVPLSPGLSFNDSHISYPIAGSKCGYTFEKNTGVSKHYYAWINIPIDKNGLNLTLLVVGIHFKAIPNQPLSCAQREAQAMIIRDTIRTSLLQANLTPSEANVIVMGDFNDYDNKTSDVSGNIPLSRTLEILRDHEYLNLVNVMDYVPLEKRYTHWWDNNNDLRINDGELSTLDHILVSENLMKYVSDIEIHNSDLYPDGNLNISDHWPVSLTINLDRIREDANKPNIYQFPWFPFIVFTGILVAVNLFILITIGTVIIIRKIKARSNNESKHQPLEDEDLELHQVEVNLEDNEIQNEEQTTDNNSQQL